MYGAVSSTKPTRKVFGDNAWHILVNSPKTHKSIVPEIEIPIVLLLAAVLCFSIFLFAKCFKQFLSKSAYFSKNKEPTTKNKKLDHIVGCVVYFQPLLNDL